MSSTPSPSRASVTSEPAHGGDFRPPQPAHKQQRGDHGVESAPAVRRGGGFDAPDVRAGTGGGGENRGEPVRAQRGGLAPAPVGGRATVAAQHAGGRFPGGGRLAGELGPKPDGGDGGGGRAARLEELAEVGPSGVGADRGVGEPARGRRGDGQRPHRVGASGGRKLALKPIQIDRALGTYSRRHKTARATGPHFSDLATCPDAMGEGGPGGSGVSFLWTPVRNRRGRDRGLGAELYIFDTPARNRLELDTDLSGESV